MTITQESVNSGLVSVSGIFGYVAEASTLGLAVGEVPRAIETSLGNGQPFRLTSANGQEFKYQQELGCLYLTVFND